jgi:hypothetical protein
VKVGDHFEAPDVHGRIILKWTLKDVDWIHLAQDRNKWHALVNMLQNIPCHKMWGI